jgi:uncharacterized protein (TIGR00290 family)
VWGDEEMLKIGQVIATWSGGKDSCFAAYKAVQLGYTLSALANTISHDYQRVRFHGLEAKMIQLQAEALGLPLLQAGTTPENYEEEFLVNIKRGMTPQIQGVVFGDIHLQDCLAWAKKVCGKLGIEAIEPLFGTNPKELLASFIASGFQSVVVSTQASILGEAWVGRVIDQSFYDDILRLDGVDPCGENGEYHSVVIDGPLFKQKIALEQTAKVLRSGYWFLDIQQYSLQNKS